MTRVESGRSRSFMPLEYFSLYMFWGLLIGDVKAVGRHHLYNSYHPLSCILDQSSIDHFHVLLRSRPPTSRSVSCRCFLVQTRQVFHGHHNPILPWRPLVAISFSHFPCLAFNLMAMWEHPRCGIETKSSKTFFTFPPLLAKLRLSARRESPSSTRGPGT